MIGETWAMRWLIAAACITALATPALAKAQDSLHIGVARVDITPRDLKGLVGIIVKPYGGVHDRLYARALVLQSGSDTAAIVTLDLVEMGDTTALRGRIAADMAIPADHIIIAASHNHNAPRGGPITPNTSSAQGRPYSTPAYVQQVDEGVLASLSQARQTLQPARFGYATGQVDVSVARYGYTPERGWREHPNEEGFSDKTLAVVKFETLAGAPIAVLFNYAVHSNSMTGEPGNMINADIAGNAEKFVEHQFGDKVVALWSMGAAADQYPKFNWDAGLLDNASSLYQPAEMQGSMIGSEVMQALRRITHTDNKVRIFAAERIVACPMNIAAPKPDVTPPARQLIPASRAGDELGIHLGLIQLNRLAITGVSGEVGSGIFRHLKQTAPLPDTMMITLSNDRDGYIPDDAGWDHQGPQGQAFVRGCAEQAIVNNLVEMMRAN